MDCIRARNLLDSPRLEGGERWVELKQRGSRDMGVGLRKLQLDFS